MIIDDNDDDDDDTVGLFFSRFVRVRCSVQSVDPSVHLSTPHKQVYTEALPMSRINLQPLCECR